MMEPDDYDPEIDGEEGFLVDVDTDGMDDDERWDDNEVSDEFLK